MRLSQFSCLEILKFTVAVAIGFTFRILIESSHRNNIAYPPPSDTKVDEYGPVHDQLREPYQPSDREEIIHYQFFRENFLYDVPKKEPKWKMLKHEHKDLADVLRQAIRFLKNKFKINPIQKTLIGGIERIDPLRGKEYILDISLKLDTGKFRLSRIHCVRPFNDIQIIKDEDLSVDNSAISNALHLVIAANANIDLDRKLIGNLLTYLAKVYFQLEHKESLRIYLVVDPNYAEIATLKSSINKFNDEIKGPSLITLLYFSGRPFTLSGARLFALDQLPTQALKLGFLDVSHTVVTDYLIDFIRRCALSLTEELEHVAFSPIPFVIFANSSVTTEGLRLTTVNDDPIINSKYGFWDSQDYSTLCARKDTMKIMSSLTNQNSNKDSWSVYSDTIQNMIIKRIRLIRSVDPSLYISYKGYDCSVLQRLNVLPEKECLYRRS